jgi:hypothetical protein
MFGMLWAKTEKSLWDGVVEDEVAVEDPRPISVKDRAQEQMCTYSTFECLVASRYSLWNSTAADIGVIV